MVSDEAFAFHRASTRGRVCFDVAKRVFYKIPACSHDAFDRHPNLPDLCVFLSVKLEVVPHPCVQFVTRWTDVRWTDWIYADFRCGLLASCRFYVCRRVQGISLLGIILRHLARQLILIHEKEGNKLPTQRREVERFIHISIPTTHFIPFFVPSDTSVDSKNRAVLITTSPTRIFHHEPIRRQ